MAQETPAQQLQMIWPRGSLIDPAAMLLPCGYRVRRFRTGDENEFFRLMHLAGFEGWDTTTLQPWLARIIPDGWFFVVDETGGALVTTAMTTHRPSEHHPFGGELSWVAGHPEHAGKGLGKIVCAAVVHRFLSAGYRNIYLYTDDWRLPAIKSYLQLGFIPLLFVPEMAERWEQICTQLGWPFSPADWPVSRNFHTTLE